LEGHHDRHGDHGHEKPSFGGAATRGDARDHDQGALLLGSDRDGQRARQRPAHGPRRGPAGRGCPHYLVPDATRGSRKAEEIARTGRLTVVFQHDADDAYVTLIGRATVVTDRSIISARWQKVWNLYFPKGEDDENAIFLRVEAERIELWVRGVTAEPFGTRGAILERDPGQAWRLLQN